MAIQVINIGTSANKGDGEPLRTAFDKINDNFAELSLKVTNLETGGVTVTTGDIKGSVFGDDSTLLVDGINSTIPSANLSGALPAIDGSALTGINSTTLGGQNASYYLDYNNFTNTPTLFSGAYADLTGKPTLFSGAFADLTSKPTTLSGYGISDAYTKTEVDNAISSSVLTSGSTHSIDIVAADSTLLVDSVNGTLNATTLTGALPAIDGSALTGITATTLGGQNASYYLDYNNFTNTPTLFSGAFADLTGKPTTIAGYGITDAFDGVFASLTSKPSTIAGYGITDALATPGDNIALGTSSSAGTEGVGIGKNANAGNYAQAIGNNAGNSNQGQGAVALGSEAGESDQGNKAVAIGNYAGETTQGANAIAIGEKAGQTNQAANSIVLNATGAALENTTSDSMVVKPIRNASGTHQLEYNPTTGEVTYDTLGAGSSYTDSDVDTHLNTGTAGAGEVLSWTGADYDWVANAGGLSDVVSDTTPQLGGALDLNNNNITGSGSINISGGATISGNLVAGTGTVGGLTFAGTQIASDDSTQISFQDNIEIAGGPVISGFNLSHTGTFTINPYGLNLNTTGGNIDINPNNNLTLDVTGSSKTISIGNSSTSGSEVSIGAEVNNTSVRMNGVTEFNARAIFSRGTHEIFYTFNGQGGVTDHNVMLGHLFYHTGVTSDLTPNFTNFDLTAEDATNITIIIQQGNTAYEIPAIQIGGAAQTIVWQGNSAPTGTANGTDSFSFTILNDGGTYVVLGQMVSFGGV